MPLSTVWHSEAASSVAASGPARISGSGSPVPYCRAQRLAQRGHRVLAGHGHRAHPQLVRLLGEQPDPAAGGGQRGDPEAVGVAQHEVDGLGADRPGGAEDHDVARRPPATLRPCHCRWRRARCRGSADADQRGSRSCPHCVRSPATAGQRTGCEAGCARKSARGWGRAAQQPWAFRPPDRLMPTFPPSTLRRRAIRTGFR